MNVVCNDLSGLYLGISRELSRAIWGFGVTYLGLFEDLAWVIWGYLGIYVWVLSGVISPTSRIFLGNHDDNNQ